MTVRPRRSTSIWSGARIVGNGSPRCRPTASSNGSGTPRPGPIRLSRSSPQPPVCRCWPAARLPRRRPGELAASGPGRPPRLRDPPRARPGRHGRRLPGREQAHGAEGSAQGRRQPPHQPPRRPRPLPRRDPPCGPAPSPQRGHGLLGPSPRREPRPGHGVRRGPRPGEDWSRPAGRCRWPMPATTSTRRPWACSTRTSTAWSTATSSRAT